MSGRRATSERTAAREAYFLDFATKVRATVDVPLCVTGGFRTSAGMEQALREGALDLVGLARPLAIDPDFPNKVLAGEATAAVRPITTGIRKIDDAALMEVSWYSLQLRRMGRGLAPKPDKSALLSLVEIACEGGIRTFRTRRLRA